MTRLKAIVLQTRDCSHRTSGSNTLPRTRPAGSFPVMTTDRPVLGIILMLGFCLFAPVADGMAKALSEDFPVFQLVAVRFAVQALLLLPVLMATFRRVEWTVRLVLVLALRTILQLLGISLMFLALRHIPLADAIAIAYVMPFILLLLGWFFLGEVVGAKRLSACAVGFAGTLMVMQPSFAAVGLPALLPLGVAVVFALFMIVTRPIARQIDPLTLQGVTGLVACAILALSLPAMWTIGMPGSAFVTPSGEDWSLLFLLGFLGTVAHVLLTWSLRYAPASTLAPVQYLEIPFAAMIGFLMFGDFPNGLALAGIVVTIAAGLCVIARERAVSQKTHASRLPAPPAA